MNIWETQTVVMIKGSSFAFRVIVIVIVLLLPLFQQLDHGPVPVLRRPMQRRPSLLTLRVGVRVCEQQLLDHVLLPPPRPRPAR